MAIRSFKDKKTATVFAGECPKGFQADIVKVARRKMALLDAAISLDVLSKPLSSKPLSNKPLGNKPLSNKPLGNKPLGNRLEALAGNRKGQHSIRVNDQFRICFIWTNGGAENVEITDYH